MRKLIASIMVLILAVALTASALVAQFSLVGNIHIDVQGDALRFVGAQNHSLELYRGERGHVSLTIENLMDKPAMIEWYANLDPADGYAAYLESGEYIYTVPAFGTMAFDWVVAVGSACTLDSMDIWLSCTLMDSS